MLLTKSTYTEFNELPTRPDKGVDEKRERHGVKADDALGMALEASWEPKLKEKRRELMITFSEEVLPIGSRLSCDNAHLQNLGTRVHRK